MPKFAFIMDNENLIFGTRAVIEAVQAGKTLEKILIQKGLSNELYHQLKSKGVDVLYDDRLGIQAGEKLADADLIGIPLRVVVSKKTLAEKSVECKKRRETINSIIKISNFNSY